MEIERRYFKSTTFQPEGEDEIEFTAVELRLDEEKPKITGYAARFDIWTDIGGWFKEKIAPGAFKKTIKDGDVRGLWNHDPNFVLGRNKAGTLSLKEDDKGLLYEITPPDTQWARDLQVSIKRGDVSQSSYGFNVVASEDNHDNDERVLTEVRLWDVSPVTYPAEPSTTSEVRSAFGKTDKTAEEREAEENAERLESLLKKLRSGDELSKDDLTLLRYLSEVSEPATVHSDTLKPVNSHLLSPTQVLLGRFDTINKPLT